MSATEVDAAAAVQPPPVEPAGAGAPAPRRPRRGRGITRRMVLGVAAIYFVGPLIAAITFTVQDPNGGLSLGAYQQIFTTPATGQIAFTSALVYSLTLAVATIVLTLALLIPTQLLLHLRLPRWRGLVEAISLMPLVFPPVVLVVGVSDVYAAAQGGGAVFSILKFLRSDSHPLLLALLYVVLAMPFVYRAIDAGIRSIDVRTLVEAAVNLGAGWPTILARILMPSLRTAIINASFLCFALVMGEYTISSILLYNKPFPVWLAQLPTTSGQVQAAVSVFSLLLVELLLLLIGSLNWRRTADKKD